MFAEIHLHLVVYVFHSIYGVRAATAAEPGGTAALALDSIGPDSASYWSGVLSN